MAAGLTTGLMSNGALSGSYMFRNSIMTNVQENLFNATYESTTGPTKENAAQLQHQQDVEALANEIAAKETPEAVAARNEKNYFAKSAEEKQLQAQKDALQAKIDENALEQAVKADEYYLVPKEWDRNVIRAANGETVTIEIEDKSGQTNADGSYPKKTLEITKSDKLKGLASNATGKKTTKTAASIKNSYERKKDMVREQYYLTDKYDWNKGVVLPTLPDYNTKMQAILDWKAPIERKIEEGYYTGVPDIDDCTGKNAKLDMLDVIYGRKKDALVAESSAYSEAASKAIKAKQVEGKKRLAQLEEDCDKEIANLTSDNASAAPASTGKNVEPHTIAIYAPGYCMNDGCCLEKAYYTLRSCCKDIEDNAEGSAKKLLSDMYAHRKELNDNVLALEKKQNDEYDKAMAEATKQANAAYVEAQKAATKVVKINGKVQILKGTQPKIDDYKASTWLDNHPELLDATEYYSAGEEYAAAYEELDIYDEELNEKLEETMATLKQDAVNYRILLDHCTFQPTCPEWLEDAGSTIADAVSATGEALCDALEWSVGSVMTSINWVSEASNSTLAYIGDLQDQLNEVVGFEGLCSLNPFGGTLGCRNCPMGSNCNANKDGLLGKIAKATAESTFLNNLVRALGLGKGQILGNLLRCIAALTGELTSTIASVASFSVQKGLATVLGPASGIIGTSSLPGFNTTVASCVSNITEVSEAKSAISLLNTTAGSPMKILQSNTPGLSNTSIVDLSKIDQANKSSNYFTTSVLGSNTSSMLSTAKNLVDYQAPAGSTKYYDGKLVDQDSLTNGTSILNASGFTKYIEPAKEAVEKKSMLDGLPDAEELTEEALDYVT